MCFELLFSQKSLSIQIITFYFAASIDIQNMISKST